MYNDYLYILSTNLCRICDEKNVSIFQLAEAIDKSPRQISRYRNGQCSNISLSTLVKISKYLDISLVELLL